MARCILFLLSSLVIVTPTIAQETTAYDFEHDNLTRTYWLHVPEDYDQTDTYPLVVVLHGRNITGRDMIRITRMNDFADEYGFIVLYPDGIDRQWNYLRGFEWFASPEHDDTDFILTLIESLQDEYSIDANQLYVTGFSNGGFMTQRLACDAHDTFVAAAVVGAGGYTGLDVLCQDAAPIPILLMHGTHDAVVPWTGTSIPAGDTAIWVSAPLTETVGFWGVHLNCAPEFEQTEVPKTEEDQPTSVLIGELADCDDNTRLMVYSINGGGHNWPGVTNAIPNEIGGNVNTDIHASEEIWKFFSQHLKDEAPD